MTKRTQKSSPAKNSEHWQAHEHTTPAIQNEAQKLVDRAGSPELAKHAVDEAAKSAASAAVPGSAHDQFARQWGFPSYLALFEASDPIASAGGKQWCVTALTEDRWILWNDDDLVAAGPYPTREAAEREALASERDSGSGTSGFDTAV
jgi:hypothetical protein